MKLLRYITILLFILASVCMWMCGCHDKKISSNFTINDIRKDSVRQGVIWSDSTKYDFTYYSDDNNGDQRTWVDTFYVDSLKRREDYETTWSLDSLGHWHNDSTGRIWADYYLTALSPLLPSYYPFIQIGDMNRIMAKAYKDSLYIYDTIGTIKTLIKCALFSDSIHQLLVAKYYAALNVLGCINENGKIDNFKDFKRKIIDYKKTPNPY